MIHVYLWNASRRGIDIEAEGDTIDTNIVHGILERIIDKLLGDIVTVALVGSSVSGRGNDIDILVITRDTPSYDTYRDLWFSIQGSCSMCRAVVSTGSYSPPYARAGSSAYWVYVMLYGLRDYMRVSPLLRRTWLRYNKTLYGRGLDWLGPVDVSLWDVFHDDYGILRCTENISNGYFTTSPIIDYESIVPRRRVIPIDGGLVLQYSRYCLRWSLYNLLSTLYSLNPDPHNHYRLAMYASRLLGIRVPAWFYTMYTPEEGDTILGEALETLSMLTDVVYDKVQVHG